MRVLIVSHYCLPHLGGIEALSFDQAKALAHKGNHVTIVSSRTRNELEEEKIDAVRILRVPAFNYLEEHLGIPYPIFSWSLVRIIFKELGKADVCIIHSFGFMSSFVAALGCLTLHVPYVIIQNNQFIRYKSSILNFVEQVNDSLVGRFVLANASELLAVSGPTKEYIRNLSGRSPQVLYNPVDTGKFCPIPDKQGAKRSAGLPEDKSIVLTSGRLISNKSPNTLVEVAHLLQDDERFFFAIAGDGPARAGVEHLIKKLELTSCVMLGQVDHDKMSLLYQTADFFVFPSKAGEGWPIAILEAMASGVPVITTRIGGQSQFIEHGESGFFVDTGAPGQIAAILRRLVGNPLLLETIGRRERQLVCENFSHERIAEALQSVMETIVEIGPLRGDH